MAESRTNPLPSPEDAPPPGPDRRPAARRGAGGGKKTKRTSIRQIAQLAGVSVATVSMVLNNNPKITEATRRKVNRVISDVGYRPNRLAQSLSGQYTRVLAVLMPTLRHAVADPYFGELISGICDRAAKRGHKVMLEHAKPEFIKQNQHLELFERRFVDGVFCIGFNDKHPFLTDIHQRDFPMIAVNNVFPDWGLDHVVCDYRSGAEQVMTYLRQLGHRKIGLIYGSLDAYTARTIVDVYRQRMHDAGVEADDTWMIDGHFTEEHGADAARRLLEHHPDLTAIFAGNDKMALGSMHYITHQGKAVPGDVSIVGFDDIPHTAFVTPALTTVHTPLYELGVLAADRLIERIRGKARKIADVLPTHLVLRESTSLAARD